MEPAPTSADIAAGAGVWTSTELALLSRRLAGLHRLAGEFRMQRDIAAIMELIVASTRVIIPFDDMLLVEELKGRAGEYRVCLSSRRGLYAPPHSPARAALPTFRGGFLGSVLKTMSPLLVRNADAALMAADPASTHIASMRSACVVPLHEAADAGPEVFVFTADAPNRFTEDDLRESVVLGNLATSVVSNLFLAEQVDNARRRLDAELRAVAQIQYRLLPQKPPVSDEWSFAVHYATSAAAGGDYYDFFPLDDGRLGLLIADASGHGAPAAVVMAVTRALLHASPLQEMRPADVLAVLNARLCANMLDGQFVTAWFGILQTATGEMEFANAGHNPPMQVRHGSAKIEDLINRGGTPLGIFDDVTFKSGRIRIDPCDMLLLYTDGLVEAMSPAMEQFGDARVQDILRRHRSDGPVVLVEDIKRQVAAHTAGAAASDDLTVVAVRREPPLME